jgi:signal transduction histidine kinase
MMTRQGAISATYEYRRGELTVTIEDTGGGIDSAVLPIVFERFSRDENGRMCGSGLDLPIIQLMVEQMGGSVDMQSEKGKGTTVWFSIPCTAKVQEKKREGVS